MRWSVWGARFRVSACSLKTLTFPFLILKPTQEMEDIFSRLILSGNSEDARFVS